MMVGFGIKAILDIISEERYELGPDLRGRCIFSPEEKRMDRTMPNVECRASDESIIRVDMLKILSIGMNVPEPPPNTEVRKCTNG